MAANKNQTTKEILRIVEYQIEQIFTEVEKIKQDNRSAHDEVKDDLRFIKNNLFDPKEGIWTEVKSLVLILMHNFLKKYLNIQRYIHLEIFPCL